MALVTIRATLLVPVEIEFSQIKKEVRAYFLEFNPEIKFFGDSH